LISYVLLVYVLVKHSPRAMSSYKWFVFYWRKCFLDSVWPGLCKQKFPPRKNSKILFVREHEPPNFARTARTRTFKFCTNANKHFSFSPYLIIGFKITRDNKWNVAWHFLFTLHLNFIQKILFTRSSCEKLQWDNKWNVAWHFLSILHLNFIQKILFTRSSCEKLQWENERNFDLHFLFTFHLNFIQKHRF
jgi:hypothetical protein